MLQKQALDILKAGRNVYLTGAAGSGKTFILNEYITYLKERGVKVAITASTGIAATHLGGMTIHAWSGIGIKDYLSEWDIDALTQKQHLVERFEKTKVLIIDEVSMLHPDTLDMVDSVCRAMKRSDEPFGAMQIVLSGDFFQLPPITRGSFEALFADSSNAWKLSDVRTCYLTEQFRQRDEKLAGILNDMRDGEISEQSFELLNSRKGILLKTKPAVTRLYTHNVDVDSRNDMELSKIKGEEKIYKMEMHGRKNITASLAKSILAPEKLVLKKGASVMFVKNNFDEGYVNGTLGIVVKFSSGFPIVETLSGDKIEVNTAQWTVEENGKILGQVEQLPLRLAWAITVHKSQGMSLDAAEIDLAKAFAPGQGYVALSRVRTLDGLSLLGLNQAALEVHPYVRELDMRLQADSDKWERVIARFSESEMKNMHDCFILDNGGTLDKTDIKENKKGLQKKGASIGKIKKVSTIEKTKELIEKGFTLKKIAKERGLTEGTIIGHIEKIKEKYSDFPLAQFEPNKSDLKKIHDAFELSKDGKLAPIYKKLNGEYTFEELRLARLFI